MSEASKKIVRDLRRSIAVTIKEGDPDSPAKLTKLCHAARDVQDAAADHIEALERENEELQRRLSTAYHIKAECNDEANSERHLRLAAERKVAELEKERDNAREYGKEARIRENKAEDARIHEQMLRHAAEADKARLREALRNVRADCQSTIDLHHRVGPSFTSPGGDEYEPASYVMDKMQELITRIDAALSGSGSGWRAIETAPNEQEVLIAYWRWRNSMSPGTIVVQSAMRTEFHGPGIWSWVVSDNKHGPFPIRGWCDGDIVGWQPLPAAPQQGGE